MLYLAYDSRLSRRKMARCCPQSQFVGRGVLPDYRWQIGARSIASTIPESGSSAPGLVYSLSPEDEARLDTDRNVGRDLGYKKVYVDIILYPAAPGPQTFSGQLVRALKNAATTATNQAKLRVGTPVLVYVAVPQNVRTAVLNATAKSGPRQPDRQPNPRADTRRPSSERKPRPDLQGTHAHNHPRTPPATNWDFGDALCSSVSSVGRSLREALERVT